MKNHKNKGTNRDRPMEGGTGFWSFIQSGGTLGEGKGKKGSSSTSHKVRPPHMRGKPKRPNGTHKRGPRKEVGEKTADKKASI